MNHCENWSTLAYTKASLLMSPPTLLNVTPVKVRPEAFSSMLAERTIGLLPLLDSPDSATMVVSVMQRIINGAPLLLGLPLDCIPDAVDPPLGLTPLSGTLASMNRCEKLVYDAKASSHSCPPTLLIVPPLNLESRAPRSKMARQGVVDSPSLSPLGLSDSSKDSVSVIHVTYLYCIVGLTVAWRSLGMT